MTTNGHSTKHGNTEVQKYGGTSDNHDHDLSYLPQWKRDYIEKKRSLFLYQKERERKKSHDDQDAVLNRVEYERDNMVRSRNSNNIYLPHDPNNPSGNDNQAVDTDTSCDSEDDQISDNKNHVTGGYSFVTCQEFQPTDENPDSDDKPSDEPPELSYQPGFVTKLLNKWSQISYGGDTNNQTDVSLNKYRVAMNNKESSHSNRHSITARRSDSNRHPDIARGFDSNRHPDTARRSDSNRHPDTARGSDSHLTRQASYRDPTEIILIETGQCDNSIQLQEDHSLPEHQRDKSIHQRDESIQQRDESISQRDEFTHAVNNDHADRALSPNQAELSVHEKVLLAKAVFQSERRPDVSPIPRPVNKTVLNSTFHNGMASHTPSGTNSPGKDTTPTVAVLPNTTSHIRQADKMLFPEKVGVDSSNAVPFFSSVKLRATKHNLFDKSGNIVNSPNAQNSNHILSSKGKMKSLGPPTLPPDISPPLNNIPQTLQPTTNKNAESSKAAVSLLNGGGKFTGSTPSNAVNLVNTSSVATGGEEVEKNSQRKQIDIQSIPDDADPKLDSSDSHHSNSNLAIPVSSQKSHSKTAFLVNNGNGARNQKNAFSASKNGHDVKKTASLKDIPAPTKSSGQKSVNLSKANQPVANENFLDILKKRRDTSSDTLPSTNIDDIINSNKSSGSKVVFDTRKSMGKRKVPEYEKIRSGPVVEFTDITLVVGKSCLKPSESSNSISSSSSSLKKNLSFNDIDLKYVHEYPSEKIMIQQIPKESGAVYFDDPDHMQAAPDRSHDDFELPDVKSFGKGILSDSLATKISSTVPQYEFGQALNAPTSDDMRYDMHPTTEADDIVIKPASDLDVKSWSSSASDGLLF